MLSGVLVGFTLPLGRLVLGSSRGHQIKRKTFLAHSDREIRLSAFYLDAQVNVLAPQPERHPYKITDLVKVCSSELKLLLEHQNAREFDSWSCP